MKVFITGATGFIGKTLVTEIAALGYTLWAGCRDMSRTFNTEHIRWLLCADNAAYNDAIAELQPDVVVHLAAYAHQTRDCTDEDRAHFLSVNVDFTKQLYQAAKQAGVKQFIFISSIGAQRSFADQLIDESMPMQPSSDYGVSKLLAEQALTELSANSATALTILRPCLVYGPGNPGNMQRLLQLIALRIPLPFASIASQRSFVYVGNLVSAICATLLNHKSYSEDFIIADNERVNLAELIRLIAQAKNESVRLFAVPVFLLKLLGRIGDLLAFALRRNLPFDSYSVSRLTGALTCSNEKMKKILKWSPPYSLQEGLELTFKQ